jgi:O-acetyl-ADP-ribose deacetylase (regulator of RNase III)
MIEREQFIAFARDDKKYIIANLSVLSAPVEAIVNPANSGLAHGGGLAAAIEREAGQEYTRACDDYVEQHGQVPVTRAAATGAGYLPYKAVIHAVGPTMGSGDEGVKIAKTVVNALQAADRLSIGTIAFPAISTGIFQVPLEICYKGFRKAVPFYWQKRPDSHIREVWLCLLNEDYEAVKRMFDA